MKSHGKQAIADVVAGNGLLHRRALLGRGLALAGAVGTGAGLSTGAAAEPLTEPDWSLFPGGAMPPYQVPSPFEKSVVRLIDNPKSDPVISHARTPHQLLNGIITPNGLHFNVMKVPLAPFRMTGGSGTGIAAND
jgi:sulfane dehydrogenase subunit SoxC